LSQVQQVSVFDVDVDVVFFLLTTLSVVTGFTIIIIFQPAVTEIFHSNCPKRTMCRSFELPTINAPATHHTRSIVYSCLYCKWSVNASVPVTKIKKFHEQPLPNNRTKSLFFNNSIITPTPTTTTTTILPIYHEKDGHDGKLDRFGGLSSQQV
jgi:hypothetical protein